MIEILGLEKRFGAVRALAGVDLRIATGRVTAVLGPNGSGKTTLIKGILGLARPDAGRVVVDGVEVDGVGAYRRRIGYMPQSPPFPENLTPAEVLQMLRDVRGSVEQPDEELLVTFGLEREMGKPFRTLSGGTRQKVNAALAFLFDPAVLILDEPTAGLDPVSSSALKDRIRRERERGKTVVLTSHIMPEVEELADEVVFLLEGSVRFAGAALALKAEMGESSLERAIARMMSRKVAA